VAAKRRRIKRDEAEEDVALVSVVSCCRYSSFPTLFSPLSYPIIFPGLWISFLAKYSTSYFFYQIVCLSSGRSAESEEMEIGG
jgi:hypothetical protein